MLSCELISADYCLTQSVEMVFSAVNQGTALRTVQLSQSVHTKTQDISAHLSCYMSAPLSCNAADHLCKHKWVQM